MPAVFDAGPDDIKVADQCAERSGVALFFLRRMGSGVRASISPKVGGKDRDVRPEGTEGLQANVVVHGSDKHGPSGEVRGGDIVERDFGSPPRIQDLFVPLGVVHQDTVRGMGAYTAKAPRVHPHFGKRGQEGL
jgi:hypothetical protein